MRITVPTMAAWRRLESFRRYTATYCHQTRNYDSPNLKPLVIARNLHHLTIVEVRISDLHNHRMQIFLQVETVVEMVKQWSIQLEIITFRRISLIYMCDLLQRENNRFVTPDQEDGRVLVVSRIVDVIVERIAIVLFDEVIVAK